MARVSLQTVFLGSLLIFNDQASSLPSPSSSSSPSSPAADPRCKSEDELKAHGDSFQKKYWKKLGDSRQEDAEKTCAQAAQEMRGEQQSRSLSPWRYRLNQEDDRFPRDIFFAECICTGCITQGKEDMDYNSLLVYAPRMVLRKTRCPSDRSKYKLEREIINVPVACTCVMPKYSK